MSSHIPQRHAGGVPVDQNRNPNSDLPPWHVADLQPHVQRARCNSDGLNEADEMNLYLPNPLLDSPFGPSDLEWLYRQQDVDGASLTSRLAQLAPISFTNTVDGQRRRRLYALDSWETEQLRLDQRQPRRPVPSRTTAGSPATPGSRLNVSSAHPQNASLLQLGLQPDLHQPSLPTPSLAHRDKKINLNYPLPVSNDPNEPIRQKWISDTYQLLKADPAAHVGRHRRGAGAAQPVRDQHHRLPRPGRHDDPLGQPGRLDGVWNGTRQPPSARC